MFSLEERIVQLEGTVRDHDLGNLDTEQGREVHLSFKSIICAASQVQVKQSDHNT